MRILTGFLTPSRGGVVFDGKDIRKEPLALRRRLGYMPENAPLYGELTVQEHLDWAARMKGDAKPAAAVAEALQRCGLQEARSKLARHLSKGYRQRVCLAQAILGPTRLIILDEPTAGLDPTQIREIRTLIRELGQEKTILLSTHILPEVELTCDRVLIINEGRIVAEDTPAGLTQAFGARGRHLLRLALAPEGPTEADVLAGLRELPWVVEADAASAAYGPGAFTVQAAAHEDHRADLSRFVFERNWPLLELKPVDAGLEEAFVHIVRDETTAPESLAPGQDVKPKEEAA